MCAHTHIYILQFIIQYFDINWRIRKPIFFLLPCKDSAVFFTCSRLVCGQLWHYFSSLCDTRYWCTLAWTAWLKLSSIDCVLMTRKFEESNSKKRREREKNKENKGDRWERKKRSLAAAADLSRDHATLMSILPFQRYVDLPYTWSVVDLEDPLLGFW